MVKFRFQRITLKIEGVFKKINNILSQKLAKGAMNLLTPQQIQNFLHKEKVNFFCKIISLYTINNLCVVIEIYAR